MRNTNFSLPVLQASRNTKRRRAWAFGVIKGALQKHVSLDAVGNVNYRLTPGSEPEGLSIFAVESRANTSRPMRCNIRRPLFRPAPDRRPRFSRGGSE